MNLISQFAKSLMLAPIAAYRWTVSPLLGVNCRHLPSCSDYAREAIDRNGAWRGSWLALARLSRCHPWGGHGYEPVPDLTAEHHPFAPWRYGRWTGPSQDESKQRAWTGYQRHPRGALHAKGRGRPAC